MDIQIFAKKIFLFELLLVIDTLSVVIHVDLEGGTIWIQSDDTCETLFEFTEETELTIESIVSTIQKIKSIVFKKLSKKNEDCVVCLEETSVFTQCKHYCCHKCLEKITVCPICRRTF